MIKLLVGLKCKFLQFVLGLIVKQVPAHAAQRAFERIQTCNVDGRIHVLEFQPCFAAAKLAQ